MLAAGRRSGKTFLAGIELIRAAWGPGRSAVYVAPTYKQAKRIAWKQLKQLTKPWWASNPPVKDRINCVNAKLRNYAGHHSLLVDPACKQLIKDFEQVCWKADPNGNALAELDKSDPMRTHTSDAVGYLIAQDFPMRSTTLGEHGGPPIV